MKGTSAKDFKKKAELGAFNALIAWMAHITLFFESLWEFATLLPLVYFMSRQAWYSGLDKGFSDGVKIGTSVTRKKANDE